MTASLYESLGVTHTDSNNMQRSFSVTPGTATLTGESVNDRDHLADSAAHAIIEIDDIAAVGRIGWVNLSDVNIQVGLDIAAAFHPFSDTPPGKVGYMPGDATADYAIKAASGTAKRIRFFVADA